MNQRLFNKVIHINGLKYEFTPYGIKFVKRLISNGWSYSKIGKLLGISQNTIAYRCREYGIDKPTKWVGAKKKYPLNEDYFENIDSPEKAYWLGLIASDGYINTPKGILEIGLQRQDENHIVKFAKAINTKKPIYQKDSKCKGKTYPSSILRIYSRKMIEDLSELGITDRKSLTYKPPSKEQIPDDLIKYYILGLFDGDGTVSIAKNGRYMSSFLGTFEAMYFIQKFFRTDMTISEAHPGSNKNTYTLRYSEGPTKKILDYLYDEYSIKFCLQRKYQKYLEICEIDKRRKGIQNGY